ncbi:MAG: acetyl-CoA acetyltransferase [Acidimicrobiia bacterium]
MTDPRAPVIVGVAQLNQRAGELADAQEPIALLAATARMANDDAGADLIARVDAVGVVQILTWRYPDAAARLANDLAIAPRALVNTAVGGNSPQLLVNTFAEGIARGVHDVVLIGGAECGATRGAARREGVRLDWVKDGRAPATEFLGDDRAGTNDYENAHLALEPVAVYPLFETALRHRARRTVAEHQQFLGELWSNFAAVAATNPAAWDRTPYTAAQIATVAPSNRVVCFPYTKRMCAHANVDQAAALIMCSHETARAAGVPDDRMVFVHGGADAHDHWWFTERNSFTESPAICAVTADTLAASNLGVDDIARFDLYSCFPSAVELAVDALALNATDSRPLTVTGGLAYAGGPWNNYPTHSVAAMVDACRADPGSFGLITALGWYATKHSAGVYSTAAPTDGFRRVDPAATQAAVDDTPTRAVAASYTGAAVVEATSVPHDRNGTPTHAIVSAITTDGQRVLATTTDPALLASVCTEAWEGRTVEIRMVEGTGTHTLYG